MKVGNKHQSSIGNIVASRFLDDKEGGCTEFGLNVLSNSTTISAELTNQSIRFELSFFLYFFFQVNRCQKLISASIFSTITDIVLANVYVKEDIAREEKNVSFNITLPLTRGNLPSGKSSA